MKGCNMIKKGSFLILVLLLSLPGCGKKKEKKAARPKKTEVTQVESSGASKELDLAEDATIKSFFDEMDEFSKLEGQELDLAEADSASNNELTSADETDSKKLDPVYFAFDKYNVASEQKGRVTSDAEKVKRLLAEAKADGLKPKLMIDGYACDSAGTKDYNLKLSQKRAKEVTGQLVKQGVLPGDVESKGYGATNLVLAKGSRDEQWVNRRVELHIVYS